VVNFLGIWSCKLLRRQSNLLHQIPRIFLDLATNALFELRFLSSRGVVPGGLSHWTVFHTKYRPQCQSSSLQRPSQQDSPYSSSSQQMTKTAQVWRQSSEGMPSGAAAKASGAINGACCVGVDCLLLDVLFSRHPCSGFLALVCGGCGSFAAGKCLNLRGFSRPIHSLFLTIL